jgi:hypothetical protein
VYETSAEYIEKHLGKTFLAPNPAVATGFTINVPASEYWLVRCLTFQLVSDANAASRIVFLDFVDAGANKIGRFSSGFTQTAGLTTQYTFSSDIAAYGANAAASIGAPTPNVWLYPGSKLTVGITAVQVGDQISNINLTVDQQYGGSYSDS